MAVSMQATPATMQQGIREIVDISKGDMKVQDPRWRELALQVNLEILENSHNVQKTIQAWFDPSLNLEPRLEKHEPRLQEKLGQDRYQDITYYFNFFMPDAGYVTEVQLLHPFARYTFTVDSALRRDPNCGLVDLWTKNKDGKAFYLSVKEYILDVKNGLTPERTKQELIDEAIALHSGNVPHELMEILEAL